MSPTGMDPLVALRRHAADAPWAVGDLAQLADRLLAANGGNGEKALTERTVRYWVSCGVVRPPSGRGRGATWGYPHLVDLLAVRAAQRDGETLHQALTRRTALDDLSLERFVADRLGAVPLNAGVVPVDAPAATRWLRYEAAPGVELHLRADHPLVGDPRRLGAVLDGLAREAGPSARES
jgi:hypothetical protein